MSTEPGEPDRVEKRGLIDPIDTLLAACIIAVCAYLYYVTTTFEEPSALLGQNVLPSDFPQGLLILIGGLALLLPFEHLFELNRWPKIKKSREEPVIGLTWATMALLVVLTAAAPYLGTILTILLVALSMPLLWGERRFVLIGLFAVGFTGAVVYVFGVLLRVHFEPGILGIKLI